MLLQQNMLQNFVDKIIADIGYNINIINNKGIIVASGSKERIGTFHAVGYEAATKEIRIDIDQADEKRFEGVKAGINQPFYYNGNLSGVIGITGNSREISEFVRVVKTMIELMVEQELLKERMYYRQSNKSYFANLLLNMKTDDDKTTLIRWSKKLGYELETPRTAIVVAFEGKYNDSVYSDITKGLKGIPSHKKEDFSAMIGSDRLLILKHTTSEQPADSFCCTDSLSTYAGDLLNMITSLGITNVHVGIGSQYTLVEEQVNGYDEAAFCINQMKKEGRQNAVASIYDYLFMYMVSHVPGSLLKHFIEDIYRSLAPNKELLETVRALTMNNMNLVDTAKSLYVHRNTVVFRLNKLKEMTGLDPTHNHRDRMMCHLLSAYSINKTK